MLLLLDLEFTQFSFGYSGNLSHTLRRASFYHIIRNNEIMAFVDWHLSSIPDMVRKYCQCAEIGCWALMFSNLALLTAGDKLSRV